jgi:hypothetical protein
MALQNASGHKLYLVESSVNKLVGSIDNVNLDNKTDVIDLTTKDNSGNRAIMMGLMSSSLNLDGKVDFIPDAAVRNFDDFYTLWAGRTSATLLLKDSVVGNSTQQFTAYVTSLQLKSGKETSLDWSASLEITGAITAGVNA